jgi:hypothetical protein
MKVVDLANQIWLENAQPSDTSIPSIAFWIKTNLGKLNNLIYESFVVDPTSQEIFNGGWPVQATTQNSLKPLAAAIIKQMYKVYRTDLDIRSNITALSTDNVLEAQDENFKIKRVNRSEVLKTLTQLKKDSVQELREMIHYYRSYNGSPDAIAGDDTQYGYFYSVTDQYSRSIPSPGAGYGNGFLDESY